ncbi:MAG TPA: hypothetical protein VG895_03050 [Patescibacteria group bacterium]|nr:hypothetical protein [Patescibacteria group bacterium]
MFYFTKETLIKYHQLPFWNNLFFSGTPLLPDPQAPIFYLPNIIFLFFRNIDAGFMVSVFIHIFFSGIGMYLLSLLGFKFSKKISIILSILYVFSPKLSGYIEAGHYGLIASWSWLPFVFLFTILLSRKQTFKNIFLLSVFLALIFYTHLLIFIIAVISSGFLFLFLISQGKKNIVKKIIYFSLVGIFSFGFVAIALLPQLSWQNQTTRNLLLIHPDVYPKWLSKAEFIKAAFSPILFGGNFIQNLDTEKIIGIGFFVSFLSFVGFLNLNTKNKTLVGLISLIIILISLNNASPIYNLLIRENWYILFRVSTRFWFLIVFIALFLAGLGIQSLLKFKKIKFLIYIIIFLAIIESLLTSWTKIIHPIQTDTTAAPRELYEFLSSDKSMFRVFCLNRCLSQKEAANYHLQLADGYGTLQQINYYDESEQLSQSYFNMRYTLSIPPFEIFDYENLQPYSPELSQYNIKYIISNHLLTDKNLQLIKIFGQYLVYKNKINLPRSNYPINIYTPNFIQVNTSNYKSNSLILSEVYNQDWYAFANGNRSLKINETLSKTREVSINKNTKFVNFVYKPTSFIFGLAITTTTIITSFFIFAVNTFKNKKKYSKH